MRDEKKASGSRLRQSDEDDGRAINIKTFAQRRSLTALSADPFGLPFSAFVSKVSFFEPSLSIAYRADFLTPFLSFPASRVSVKAFCC